MTKPRRPWIVTRHDPLEKLDDNLWAVSGDVPGIPFPRRMCIVKLRNGDLLFFHAMPLDDSTLQEILAWGKPAILVLPHDQHAIDADAFQKRLALRTYGPRASAAKLRTRVDLSGTFDDLRLDDSVEVQSIRGAKSGEPVLLVKSGDGARTSLLFADALQNIARERLRFLPRLMGFGGGPKVVPIFKHVFVNDKPGLRADFDAWAKLPNLARIVPFHGDIIGTAPSAALQMAAAGI